MQDAFSCWDCIHTWPSFQKSPVDRANPDKTGLNHKMQGHSFPYHWLTKATIMICLVLQSFWPICMYWPWVALNSMDAAGTSRIKEQLRREREEHRLAAVSHAHLHRKAFISKRGKQCTSLAFHWLGSLSKNVKVSVEQFSFFWTRLKLKTKLSTWFLLWLWLRLSLDLPSLKCH